MVILTMLVFGAVVGLFCLIAVPIVLVGVLMGVVLYALAQLLFLPFRLIGWSLALGTGVILLAVKILALLVLGFIGTIMMVAMTIPLLPLALIAVGIWLAVRARRRQAEADVRAV